MAAAALYSAISSLRGSLLRSLLATLGMAFGVAAAIAMIAVGKGSQARVQAELEALGGDLIIVRPVPAARSGLAATLPARPLELSDVAAIAREVTGVRIAAPFSSKVGLVTGSTGTTTSGIVGTTASYFQARRWSPTAGRLFSEYEEQIGKSSCVLGATAARRLFGRGAAVGESIRIGAQSCEVIGVLARRGSAAQAGDEDNLVALPILAFHRRVQGKSDVDTIYVAGVAGASTERLKARIDSLMSDRRGNFRGGKDIAVDDMAQTLATARGAGRTMTLLLGAITVISLLIGGVGVMNVMLSSLSERRREIGVRLAIGATPADIRLQFVVEAVIVSLAGGAVGVVLGLIGAVGASFVLEMPMVIDPVSILLALGFTSAIGLAFGYGPAARAARLDPIAALAHT